MKQIVLTLLSVPLLLLTFASCSKLMAESHETKGVFEYRDIYLPEYSKKANQKLDLNNIDEDWGLWGHNIGAVLPENPSMQVYAKVGGSPNKDQFCFSSNRLYDYIVDYIRNNYIFRDTVRFAILPNDNGLVCQCSECVRVGNTKGNASPAVLRMIDRLSKKFPQHEFYTSYYSTTKQLPEEVMPPNSGVIVSAIDFPLTAGENSKDISFMALIDEWKGKTDNIYIWDYLNNFDDYFTPSPIFGPMQHRLKLYRDEGVNGVFLNGSGNDYSTFSKLKKAVLAQMMINPDLDWEELLRDYAKDFYPVAGKDIADFIVLQERKLEETGAAVPHYEGVEKARKLYLPEKQFVEFYNKLLQHKKTAGAEEKEELREMTDAMALTMLELKRINGDVSDTDKLKERLRRMINRGTEYYNEGAWSIAQYIDDYDFMEKEAADVAGANLVKGVNLRKITPLDEDYTDIKIVTDGLLGIPSNYHNGNLIISAAPQFNVGIPRQPGMKKVKVWMVHNPGFKIGLPAEVYVSADGVRSKAQIPERNGATGHSSLEFDIPASSGDIVLTLVKDPDVKTMAIDEVEVF